MNESSKKLKLFLITNKVKYYKNNIPKSNFRKRNLVVPIRHFPPATKE
jgi:hypothetical protein